MLGAETRSVACRDSAFTIVLGDEAMGLAFAREVTAGHHLGVVRAPSNPLSTSNKLNYDRIDELVIQLASVNYPRGY
jgi:hypothetical protein